MNTDQSNLDPLHAQMNVIGNGILVLLTNMVWGVAFSGMTLISYMVTHNVDATIGIFLMLVVLAIILNATILRDRWSVISQVK